jgi:hypothetical protein
MPSQLFSKVHALYDRVIHGGMPAPKADAVVRPPVRDTPSQRITRPVAAQIDADADAGAAAEADADEDDQVGLYDARDVEPMSAAEADQGDRDDGENWAESSLEAAVDTLPAERPIVIDDEPTGRHEH